MDKKQIIFSLIIICLISLGLKLYLVDFSIPVNSDNLGYTLNAIAHTNGDFSQSSHRGMGWSLFVSIFFGFIDSENLNPLPVLLHLLELLQCYPPFVTSEGHGKCAQIP